MKIKSIQIENIKSFQNSETIHLNEGLNIFIGPNGSGKTTVVQLIINALFKITPEQYLKHRNNTYELEQTSIAIDSNAIIFPPFKEYEQQQIFINLSLENSISEFKNEVKDYIHYCNNNWDEITKRMPSIKNNSHIHDINKWQDNEIDIIDKQLYLIMRVSEKELHEAAYEEQKDLYKLLYNIKKYRKIAEMMVYKQTSSFLPSKSAMVVYFSSPRNIELPSSVPINHGQGYPTANSFESSDATFSNMVRDINRFGPNYFHLYMSQNVEKYIYERWNQIINTDTKLPNYEGIAKMNNYLKKYINISISVIPPNDSFQGNYSIEFEKNGKNISPNNLSSGEKSMVHLLSGLLYADSFKDSIVLIDEPELHLHKKYQSELLNIFKKHTEENNNQIIISTHSPSFVNEKIMYSIHRTYKEEEQSKVYSFQKNDNKKTEYDLMRIINTHNNEKIFFADKVILVEGIRDYILINRLVQSVVEWNNDNILVEVIDIRGKGDFKNYFDFLKQSKMSCFAIADFDNLQEYGDDKTNNMFIKSPKKVERDILIKDCKDKELLIECLEDLVCQYDNSEENKTKVKKIIKYLYSRKIEFKKNLNPNDTIIIKKNIIKISKNNNIFIHHLGVLDKNGTGTIEDYIPKEYRSKSNSKEANGKLIDFLTKDVYLQDLFEEVDNDLLKELFYNLFSILGIKKTKYRTFLKANGISQKRSVS